MRFFTHCLCKHSLMDWCQSKRCTYKLILQTVQDMADIKDIHSPSTFKILRERLVRSGSRAELIQTIFRMAFEKYNKCYTRRLKEVAAKLIKAF